MVWEKKNANTSDPFMIEGDSETPFKEVNIEDILYKLIYIIALEYGQKRYDRFKSFVESLQAVMTPTLADDFEEQSKKESLEIDKKIQMEISNNRHSKAYILDLKSQLEIQYYYNLWRRLLKEIRRQGLGYIRALTLPA
jgi:hypothetical protein